MSTSMGQLPMATSGLPSTGPLHPPSSRGGPAKFRTQPALSTRPIKPATLDALLRGRTAKHQRPQSAASNNARPRHPSRPPRTAAPRYVPRRQYAVACTAATGPQRRDRRARALALDEVRERTSRGPLPARPPPPPRRTAHNERRIRRKKGGKRGRATAAPRRGGRGRAPARARLIGRRSAGSPSSPPANQDAPCLGCSRALMRAMGGGPPRAERERANRRGWLAGSLARGGRGPLPATGGSGGRTWSWLALGCIYGPWRGDALSICRHIWLRAGCRAMETCDRGPRFFCFATKLPPAVGWLGGGAARSGPGPACLCVCLAMHEAMSRSGVEAVSGQRRTT
ncbi:hypothetical protein BDY21DRAFT_394518 [Lineolata rhizophorae]|uniref:Uncharacterized protein n=1 Tax=Lineolata rhizophorae TaxID=578093 RepID=A0A6A6NWK4_9PEZI|nr:hypothetical protein BDY21DRAFT_394518 [Lineolata rhizophorae]